MKPAARIISWTSLGGLTLLPPILYALGFIDESALKLLMLVGAVIWFVATPIWLKGNTS